MCSRLSNIKSVIFYILVLILFLVVFKLFYIRYDKTIDANDIVLSRKEYIFVKNFKYGSYYSSYDNDSNTFYLSSGSLNKVGFKVISPYKTKFHIIHIADNEYEVIFYSNKYYQRSKVILLDIPIISISTNSIPSCQKKDYDLLSFDIKSDSIDIGFNLANYNAKQNVFSDGNMHVRGATSRDYDKKSYKIELSKKYPLLGMNSDDDWILDSLYSDLSKVRNKLSSDLWNVINNNQVINNDLKGEFVEVFIDNNYSGLYVLKEKVDKNITGISDDGLILKAEMHLLPQYIQDFVDCNNLYSSLKKDSFIGNLQVKKITYSSFSKFCDLYSNYYTSSIDYDSINNTFDIDNYINYKVFLAITLGGDNLSKNFYLSLKDDNSKLLITPWDMDLTFGNVFSHTSFSKSSFTFENNPIWLDMNIMTESDELNELITNRYWQLRKKINKNTIYDYLDDYSDIILKNKSNIRDSNKWYYYDFENEIQKIKVWIDNRFDFLDNYFN